ncbi:hypothetical protein QBC44DRAFT_356571 [Cladorrhinum sp. PSN332]|nr:hypothetical protein QBC44DRAFT_356571 [Cladorrhinum sp. PSN332]
MDRPPNSPPSTHRSNPPSITPSNNPVNSSPHLRPLLPAPPQSDASRGASSPVASSQVVLAPRRQPSSSACDMCRRKKTKCDNKRPSCGRCLAINETCFYDANADETSGMARKRKYIAADKELSDFRELFELLRHPAVDVASAIFSRIRVADDLLEVLQSVRDAEVLRSARDANVMLAPRSSSLGSQSSSINFPGPSVPASFDQHVDSSVLLFRVPAKPWTSLVSDVDVSELVARFFSDDNPYLLRLAIDRDALLQDMRGANPRTAEHCSPLLVNAICAMGCLDGRGSRALLSLFVKESNRLLDLEQGRASLTTSIALYLLYLVSTFLGRDRDGLRYRHMSIGTLQRLRLENKYSRLEEGIGEQPKAKLHISRTLWGFFIVETRLSILYGEVSLAPPLHIAPRFIDSSDLKVASPTSDPIANIGPPLPTMTDLFHAACDLAKLHYDLQVYIIRSPVPSGSDEDIQIKIDFLSQLQSLISRSNMWEETGALRQACHLRLHSTEVLLSLLRTLPSGHPLPDFSSADRHGQTTVDHLFQFHAKSVLDTVNKFSEQEQLHHRHFTTGVALYHVAVSMIPSFPLLSDSTGGAGSQALEIFDIFSSCCAHLFICAQVLPLSRRLLQGVAALAWKSGRQIPPQAQTYFNGLGYDQEGEAVDVPVAFAVPRVRGIVQSLTADELETELGGLISEWLQSTSRVDDVGGSPVDDLGRQSVSGAMDVDAR